MTDNSYNLKCRNGYLTSNPEIVGNDIYFDCIPEDKAIKGSLLLAATPSKKQSLCKFCVTKMARRIYSHFGLSIPCNALLCDEEDTCDWERTADCIIRSLDKAVDKKISTIQVPRGTNDT